ncbi:MAG: TetR-like C-terminal domain-containing protein [Chloroflexi bacterium]|nr:TetR-like C-terminal domain-containing protein [Chloroflexota bacterium]
MVVRESLLTLLAQKSIKQITVKEICDLSQINRATFYSHYQDLYDLLEQIENELFNDILATFMKTQDDVSSMIKGVFGIIEKNIDLCQVLFSENGDRMFLQRIMAFSRDWIISNWHKQYPYATNYQLEYLYAFVIGGSVSVIEQWVRSDMKDTPLGLGDIGQKVSEIWLNPRQPTNR